MAEENQEQQQVEATAAEQTNDVQPAAATDAGDAPATTDTPTSTASEDHRELTVVDLREMLNPPAEWSDEAVVALGQFAMANPTWTVADFTVDGVWKFDPTRASRDVTTWSETELKLAIEGKLEGVANKQYDAIITAFKKTVAVEPAWSNAQVIDFYRNGVTPAKTSNGVWVTDVTRGNKPAESWTTAELEAWALGEIACTPRASDQKLAVALSKALGLKAKDNSPKAIKEAYLKTRSSSVTVASADQALATTTVVSADTEDTPIHLQQARATAAQVEQVEGLNPMQVSYIDSVTARYIDAVAPGKVIADATGERAQKELNNLFDYCVGQQNSQVMVTCLERLKGIIAKNLDGVFSHDNAFRFVHYVPEARGAQERHKGMLTLLTSYASPNKDLRKQLDVKYLLRQQTNEKQGQLYEYFTTIA